MKYLLASICLLFASAAHADDGLHLYVGLGVHDPAYDWHFCGMPANNGYQSNPLGVIRFTYEAGRFQINAEHISSIPNTREFHGLNILSVTVRVF